jgi:hypothetical protein
MDIENRFKLSITIILFAAIPLGVFMTYDFGDPPVWAWLLMVIGVAFALVTMTWRTSKKD